MREKFKNSWKLMIVIAILFLLGAYVPNGKQFLLRVGIIFLIVVILFVLAMYILDRYQKSKTPYMSAYLKNCDAKELLKKCEAMQEQITADTNEYYVLIQDLISAYLVNGDFDSARKWLAYMESKQKLKKEYAENVKHLGVLCAIMENDIPRANRLLDDMRNMVRKDPKNKHLRQKLANAVLVVDARTGEKNLAKNYYEKLFARGTRNLSEKLWCKYHLLAVYDREENDEKIQECLEYLDQYGNNTFMALEARKRI